MDFESLLLSAPFKEMQYVSTVFGGGGDDDSSSRSKCFYYESYD